MPIDEPVCHLDDRDKKVLDDRKIRHDIRPYRSVTAEETKALGFVGDQCRDGMAFPSYDYAGKRRGYILRADKPRESKGKQVKYDRKAGEMNWLDVPVSCREAVLDVTIPLDIPESPMKADAMLTAGSRAAVGPHGCWGHKSTMADGVGKVICPDWAHIPLKGRKVRVEPDSDVRDNPNVQAGIRDLVRYLQGRGAEVSVVLLPHRTDGSKQGVDDWLADGGKYEDLAALEVDRVPGGTVLLPNPKTPGPVARRILTMKWTDDLGNPTLIRWQDSWVAYDGIGYVIAEDAAIEAKVRSVLDDAEWIDPAKLTLNAWNPTRARVNEVLEAMASARFLPREVELGTWLDGKPKDSVGPFLAMQNGILDIGHGVVLPSSSRFFSLTTVPFAYDPEATAPQWNTFLKTLWPDPKDTTPNLIQEWYGYVLSGRTDLHKMLGLIGPPRCGKGTIYRTLKALIGPRNVAQPMMSSLAGDFGLQPLIGKSLAVIPDARWRGDGIGAIVEKLLSVTGEDDPNIPRKHTTDWSGKVGARFMILSNEAPRFQDDSAAIVWRFVLATMTESWTGREDLTLGKRLLEELPGILNWSLEGLERLNLKGRFTEPDDSAEIRREMEDSASPIKAFIRDWCAVGPEHIGTAEELFSAWGFWCNAEEGRDKTGTRATFFRSLRSAAPKIKPSRPRESDGSRPHSYSGIALNATARKAMRRLAMGAPASSGDKAAVAGEKVASQPDGPGSGPGVVRVAVRDGDGQNRRSEGVGPGGPGKVQVFQKNEIGSPPDASPHIFASHLMGPCPDHPDHPDQNGADQRECENAYPDHPDQNPDPRHKTGCRSTSSHRRSRKPSTKATDAAYIAGRICPVLSSLASRGVGRELAMFESPAFSWDFLLAADGVDVPPSKARPVLEELASRGLIEWEGSTGPFRVTPAGHQLADTLPPPLGAHAVLVGWDWNAA